ncbi:type VII toxin-antitoxin system MntA family adenylyltransferase antitoxin [Desulfovibrio desulfuricans]|uniref:type VII toxin-antitoxin system MntA family adenylyltransferase antitoxin n=1 Tax=Desulfovibrio desulfuricans TaxID=876 RepID=UPI0039840F65
MTTALIQQVARTLAPHPEIQLAFVFGSAARGALRPNSDVDVAVLAASHLSPEARLELMAELSLAVKREVDLVDLSTAWGLILRQVLTTGSLALKRSDTAHAMLLKRMLFDQADMEPLRRRIIEKNLERGF